MSTALLGCPTWEDQYGVQRFWSQAQADNQPENALKILLNIIETVVLQRYQTKQEAEKSAHADALRAIEQRISLSDKKQQDLLKLMPTRQSAILQDLRTDTEKFILNFKSPLLLWQDQNQNSRSVGSVAKQADQPVDADKTKRRTELWDRQSDSARRELVKDALQELLDADEEDRPDLQCLNKAAELLCRTDLDLEALSEIFVHSYGTVGLVWERGDNSLEVECARQSFDYCLSRAGAEDIYSKKFSYDDKVGLSELSGRVRSL